MSEGAQVLIGYGGAIIFGVIVLLIISATS